MHYHAHAHAECHFTNFIWIKSTYTLSEDKFVHISGEHWRSRKNRWVCNRIHHYSFRDYMIEWGKKKSNAGKMSTMRWCDAGTCRGHYSSRHRSKAKEGNIAERMLEQTLKHSDVGRQGRIVILYWWKRVVVVEFWSVWLLCLLWLLSFDQSPWSEVLKHHWQDHPCVVLLENHNNFFSSTLIFWLHFPTFFS